MFTLHYLEVVWHYSQLSSLFLDLNMPAILDYVSDLQAAGHKNATYHCDCGCKNRFSLCATTRLLLLSTCHISPQLQRPARVCRKCPTHAVWIKDF